MYGVSLAAVVLLYLYYTGEHVGQCKLHEFFISINLVNTLFKVETLKLDPPKKKNAADQSFTICCLDLDKAKFVILLTTQFDSVTTALQYVVLNRLILN